MCFLKNSFKKCFQFFAANLPGLCGGAIRTNPVFFFGWKKKQNVLSFSHNTRKIFEILEIRQKRAYDELSHLLSLCGVSRVVMNCPKGFRTISMGISRDRSTNKSKILGELKDIEHMMNSSALLPNSPCAQSSTIPSEVFACFRNFPKPVRSGLQINQYFGFSRETLLHIGIQNPHLNIMPTPPSSAHRVTL